MRIQDVAVLGLWSRSIWFDIVSVELVPMCTNIDIRPACAKYLHKS